MTMLSYRRKIVDIDAYKRSKEMAGFKTAEEIAKATGLALPIIKAIDDHGIILTESAMQRLSQAFKVSVYDLVKDAYIQEKK